jgi:hypothetical protein
MIDKFNLTSEGDLPLLKTYKGVEFCIRDVCGKMIRDEITGEAVLKYQKATKQYFDRDA